MKYITGKTTTYRSEPVYEQGAGTSITLINHPSTSGDISTTLCCLVLNGRRGSAAVVVEAEEDRQLLVDVLLNPPGYHDEPVRLGPYDSAYLVLDGYRGYLEISMGEVRAYVDDGDVRELACRLM